MKKITTLFLLLCSLICFSQESKTKIQNYLNINKDKLKLTTEDINDWFVEGEASSENTGITNYYIKQKYRGVELYDSSSNIWIKNGEVINGGEGLLANISSKVVGVTPSLTVLNGLTSANNILKNNSSIIKNEILTNVDQYNFKISNGKLDTISAKLVLKKYNDNLRLAWHYIIDTEGHNHVWSIAVDAVDGKLLFKHNMVISCDFSKKEDANSQLEPTNRTYSIFTENFLKPEQGSMLNVNSGSYRVIPYNFQSPSHSPRVLISNASFATASPNGWHNSNSSTATTQQPTNIYTITRGNNVWAQADFNDTNPTASASNSPNGGSSLIFDYPFGSPSTNPSTYIDAANTNLFYMNNIMHDVWFAAGFNTVNKNFQTNNNGVPILGGGPSDAVNAHAQDSSNLAASATTRNNANFFTPANGTPGRMQMYVWNHSLQTQLLNIITPTDIAGLRTSIDNAFSPGNIPLPIAPASVQQNLVLYDDGSADAGETDNADACSGALNAPALSGKIAVVRRSLSESLGGTPCSFTIKVKNAQDAGAIAVIVVNNVLPSPTIPAGISMSGADASIIIPAISVTKEIGDAIIARMKIETVNAKLQQNGPSNLILDGDLDNGIISHEYGHGISNRLSGANANCLTNAEQMGEGWSDWFALMMQIKSGDNGVTPVPIGTYASNQPNNGAGIRNYPYSTDMTINPLTFINSNVEAVHTRGEFMATVLWDLTWAYINKYGFDPNLYTGNGGNNRVMKLVIDALKLQPCNPTFVSFRNALIAAEAATIGSAGHNNCLIREVFRRRGMGLNADSGSEQNALDQIEDFTPFPVGTTPATGGTCTFLGIDSFTDESLFNVYPNPSEGIFNLKLNNYVGKIDIEITDLSGRIIKNIKNTDFNNEKTIDLQNLSVGIYMLKVSNAEINYSRKLIKN